MRVLWDLKKRCSENMQEIYRRTPMLKLIVSSLAASVHRQFCYSETSLTKLLIWKRNLKNSLLIWNTFYHITYGKHYFCKHFVIWNILLMIYLSHLVNFSLEALIIFVLFNCQHLKFTFKAVCYINNAWMLL